MNAHRFSIVDSLVLITVAVTTLSWLLPRTIRHRETARTQLCTERLRQIGLAIQQYHDSHRMFPIGSGGTSLGGVDSPTAGNADRLSALIGLLPYLGQADLYETIAKPAEIDGQAYPAMGPVPWFDPAKYKPWGRRPETFICPNDQNHTKLPTAANYVLNYGDGIIDVGAAAKDPLPEYGQNYYAKRGLFGKKLEVAYRDIRDGSAHTLLLSEARLGGNLVFKGIVGLPLDPSRCLAAAQQPDHPRWEDGRGSIWTDGSIRSLGFQTILPPNSPSCTSAKGELEAVMSASSYHVHGINVLLADASVRFVSESIDAGDSSSPSVNGSRPEREDLLPLGAPSPYGVWGALGTRFGREDTADKGKVLATVAIMTKPGIDWLEEMPMESWTTSDGTTIRARQAELSPDGWLILVTESGDVRHIELSKLESSHAHRAVENDVLYDARKLSLLVEHLRQARQFLKDEHYEDYIEYCSQAAIHPNRYEDLINRLPQLKEKVIKQYDDAIAASQREPNSWYRKYADDSILIKLPRSQSVMRFLEGRWRW